MHALYFPAGISHGNAHGLVVNHRDNAVEGRSSELFYTPPKGGQGQGGERQINLLSKSSGTSSGQTEKFRTEYQPGWCFNYSGVLLYVSSKTCFLFLFQSWFLWQNLPANKQLKSHHYNLESWIRITKKKIPPKFALWPCWPNRTTKETSKSSYHLESSDPVDLRQWPPPPFLIRGSCDILKEDMESLKNHRNDNNKKQKHKRTTRRGKKKKNLLLILCNGWGHQQWWGFNRIKKSKHSFRNYWDIK